MIFKIAPLNTPSWASFGTPQGQKKRHFRPNLAYIGPKIPQLLGETTKKAPKNEHLGHAVAHEGVQVDPKTAQGPPMATQVNLETAPTFAFNTELLRSSTKKPSEKAPPNPSADLAHAPSDMPQV